MWKCNSGLDCFFFFFRPGGGVGGVIPHDGSFTALRESEQYQASTSTSYLVSGEFMRGFDCVCLLYIYFLSFRAAERNLLVL